MITQAAGFFELVFFLMVDKCFVRDYYMFANREQEDSANND